MARKSSIVDNLLDFPWWFHLALALGIVISPYFLADYIHASHNMILLKIEPQLPNLSHIFGAIFLFFSLVCMYRKWERNKLFNHQQNLKDIYNLTWQQFETLVTEVFYRAGHRVKQRGGNHADGGIDLEAYQSGMKIIIQCKHWKSKNVGVSVVREMFGVGIHENAHQVYIITCGYFTKDAKEFAEGKSIHLIHGYKLLSWIKELRGE
jgi:restriction system protein